MQEKYIETPEFVLRVDDVQSKLIMEFTMIEVDKENITLMMNENGCYLSADAEDLQYATTLSFPYPVNPSEAKAAYKDGYLIVDVPFKEPLQNYTKIQID